MPPLWERGGGCGLTGQAEGADGPDLGRAAPGAGFHVPGRTYGVGGTRVALRSLGVGQLRGGETPAAAQPGRGRWGRGRRA